MAVQFSDPVMKGIKLSDKVPAVKQAQRGAAEELTEENSIKDRKTPANITTSDLWIHSL